jgi:hypothetical protein
MTWLYLPPETLPEPETHASSAYPSALAQAVSTSGSPSPCPDIELWAMSNGKPSPRPLSWRGWIEGGRAIGPSDRPRASLDQAVVWDDVATFDGRPWRGAVDIVTAG